MKRVRLGRTDIEVSRLGIGTGTAHPSGYCVQSLMDENELAKLLINAFEYGINFFDTAFQYRTYPHIRNALKHISRSDIILTTKLATVNEKETIEQFNLSLDALNIDHFDICLLHGVRTSKELQKRSGALETLLRFKKEGRIRAVGLSSHGFGALSSAADIPEIVIVWARINSAGINMDSSLPGLYDRLASVPTLKKMARVLPRKLMSAVRVASQSQPIAEHNRRDVENVLKKIHSRPKGVVGMKVIAEGKLRDDTERAIEYVKNLSFVDSLVIGMLSKKEIEENCRIIGEG
jgi:predicted aldo/keto reductase-like oxidoreductase